MNTFDKSGNFSSFEFEAKIVVKNFALPDEDEMISELFVIGGLLVVSLFSVCMQAF